ncbi:MAG: hypothetical protein FJ314_06400 [SAR202 cluster bacterium]|nr:hypothetical protein [SAR202 cluster bacterium]
MCDDQGNGGPEKRRRRDIGSVIANWNSHDASFGTKLRLAIRNGWIRLYRRSDCCGNDGQPGC